MAGVGVWSSKEGRETKMRRKRKSRGSSPEWNPRDIGRQALNLILHECGKEAEQSRVALLTKKVIITAAKDLGVLAVSHVLL